MDSEQNILKSICDGYIIAEILGALLALFLIKKIILKK